MLMAVEPSHGKKKTLLVVLLLSPHIAQISHNQRFLLEGTLNFSFDGQLLLWSCVLLPYE